MSLDQALEQRLTQGLSTMELVLESQQQQQLLAYLRLLSRWNQAFNLTAIRDPLEMLSHHLLDSLSLLPHLEDGPLLDVGTGAGLPGIPLAIARPKWSVSLLDANGKKVRFLRQVQLELGLTQLHPYQNRLEKWQSDTLFHTITARAFTNLASLAEMTLPHLAEGGKILAMKGTEESMEAEIQALPQNLSVTTLGLNIPFIEEKARHLVMIQRVPA